MKSILQYVVLISLILLSLSVSAQSRKAAMELKQGAQLTFIDDVSYDFGEVERKGGDLIKVFRFVNDGDSPLVIKKVAKSCSCITADFSRKPVKPNETGEIRLKYEPHKAEAGAFHKVVQIYTNTAKGEHLITIQGKSVAKRRGKK
ncbi:MAG: DUF1573 domain-containing protein [Alistipes sp.]|nr:DUF1573 domain-containing protein [Alistipes sp.]